MRSSESKSNSNGNGNGNWGMFEEEEVEKMGGFVKGSDYIEVHCGCTSKKYGDFCGKLRVSSSGHFLIFCFCSDSCNAGNLSLSLSFSSLLLIPFSITFLKLLVYFKPILITTGSCVFDFGLLPSLLFFNFASISFFCTFLLLFYF